MMSRGYNKSTTRVLRVLKLSRVKCVSRNGAIEQCCTPSPSCPPLIVPRTKNSVEILENHKRNCFITLSLSLSFISKNFEFPDVVIKIRLTRFSRGGRILETDIPPPEINASQSSLIPRHATRLSYKCRGNNFSTAVKMVSSELILGIHYSQFVLSRGCFFVR